MARSRQGIRGLEPSKWDAYPVLIDGYEFVFCSAIDVRRAEDGMAELNYPILVDDDGESVKLHKYGAGPFVFLQLSPPPPTEIGVYAVVEDGDSVLLVGQAGRTLKVRWKEYGTIYGRNYRKGGRETNCRINNLIYGAIVANRHLDLYILITPDYDSIETQLIDRLQPPWNLKGVRK